MQRRSHLFGVAVVFTMAATGFGCASTPRAETADKLARAQSAIEQAERARAPEFAATELSQARDELTQAKSLSEKGKSKDAAMQAEKAEADALYAEARARSVANQRMAQESDKSLEALREESQRAAEASSQPPAQPVQPPSPSSSAPATTPQP
jgi:hypothetical protein